MLVVADSSALVALSAVGALGFLLSASKDSLCFLARTWDSEMQFFPERLRCSSSKGMTRKN